MILRIRNFRSIREQVVELGPITVIYGPNGAGKSSLLYALLALKNVVTNPNQLASGFFNYGFANLGGFEEVVFDHQLRSEMELAFESKVHWKSGDAEHEGSFKYSVVIAEHSGRFSLAVSLGDLEGRFSTPVTFPYPGNQQVQQTVTLKETPFVVTWNGTTAQVKSSLPDQETMDDANNLAAAFNAPVEILRKVSVVPLKRGFSKLGYASVAVSPLTVTEDEVATLLATDRYLTSMVSFYLEQILERDFRVNFQPGTAAFTLDATDKKTGVASGLVNEGFGVNQIVYVLAKCLGKDTQWICLEEPEIHLHPTAVQRLAEAFVSIAREEEKHFIISTHSESFLTALLSMVARGALAPSELACYLAIKEKKATVFERQAVNPAGQIEGGLASFLEGELESIRQFLGVKG